MISDKFIILGIAIQISGNLVYALHTLQGKTKPNRGTWFLWALGPVIAFIAELNKHAGLTSFTTLSFGVGPMIVLLASFANKKSYWKLGLLDYSCDLLALAALAFWWIYKDANIAIALSLLIAILASTPTIVKSYKHPRTESVISYAGSLINSSIALLTISAWTLANSAYVLNNLLLNVIFVTFIYSEVGLRRKKLA